MLRTFGHPVTKCCDMLVIENRTSAQTWTNDHNVMKNPQVMHEKFDHFKSDPTTTNMSQHPAKRWPNARSMVRPALLRYVVLRCRDRLARALQTTYLIFEAFQVLYPTASLISTAAKVVSSSDTRKNKAKKIRIIMTVDVKL